RQLDKMDKIELDEHKEKITFQFPPPKRSGAVVVKLEHIHKRYDEKMVFENLSFSVDRGDKIAVVGPNGAGKSTLIRMMAGLEDFGEGHLEQGYNVTASYFAQHQADELDLNKDALN